MHFLGLSILGSWVLCKSTDIDCLCSLSSAQVHEAQPNGWWAKHCPRWAMHLMYLSGPRHSVCWLSQKGTVAGRLCVSGVELIWSCDTIFLCELSTNPGRHGEQFAVCLVLGVRCLFGQDTSNPLDSLLLYFLEQKIVFCEHNRVHYVVLEPSQKKDLF